MRTVAALLALSAVLVVFPLTTAANECSTNATAGQVCVPFTVARPAPPPPAPAVPDTPYWDTYYLFVKAGSCTSPLSADCRGVPGQHGSGVPTPVGPLGVGFFGVIWQETNNCNGLQRVIVAGCGLGADKMMLV